MKHKNLILLEKNLNELKEKNKTNKENLDKVKEIDFLNLFKVDFFIDDTSKYLFNIKSFYSDLNKSLKDIKSQLKNYEDININQVGKGELKIIINKIETFLLKEKLNNSLGKKEVSNKSLRGKI